MSAGKRGLVMREVQNRWSRLVSTVQKNFSDGEILSGQRTKAFHVVFRVHEEVLNPFFSKKDHFLGSGPEGDEVL